MTAAIQYVTGDATDPQGDGRKIIAHICNNAGVWGSGFVMALSARWPQPEAAYRAWHAGHQPMLRFRLGAVQFTRVAPGLQVANMVCQHGLGEDGEPAVRYDALDTALTRLANEARYRGASVHMPRIGCGLGGGKWECVEPLIQAQLCSWGVPVTVYDVPEEDRLDAAIAQAARAGSGPGIPWEEVRTEVGLS
jgi:O-acetyl-ADP-ribose deacetylase (regulator of RNase III)